jgi:phage minor structural protein
MIPVLIDQYGTSYQTTLGRLSDCVSCLVTEERNGEYEAEFEYPITGIHYEDIIEGRTILVDHDDTGKAQPFDIYSHTAPIDGIVTFHAHHVSYRLSNVILKPLTASSASSAFSKFETQTMTPQPFSFITDVSTAASFKVTHPSSVRSVLGGVEGSILDVYGGEYEFDDFTVKLHAARGANNNVTIRYAKNLTDLEEEYDELDRYTAIIPYWMDTDSGECVYGDQITARNGKLFSYTWTNQNNVTITDENGEDFYFDYYESKAVTMDFTDEFQSRPTKEQLEARAAAYLKSNKPWVPKENLEVDFVALWQTEEYKNIAPLERVGLCDTVRIIYTALGVDSTAKVIKVVWNALAERYNSIELGEAKASFADTIMQSTEKIVEDRPTYSMMAEAIDKASELIRGGTGGHVVMGVDAEGKPNEIFIMDTEDVDTAVNVLRINMNGIGFSSNGVEGEYSTAWTLDGSFVADFITAGSMAANRIRTGTLASTDGSSYWDLDGSELRFYDKRFDSYVELDEGYIRFCHGDEQFGKILRMLSGDEDLLAITGPDYNTRITLLDNVSATAEDYISQNAGTFIQQKAKDSIRMFSGADNSSMMRMYDDGNSQYIDMNSGGSTWLRIDGKNSYATLTGGANTWVRVDEGNGYVWIKASDLIINGFSGYTGSFTAGDSTVTVKNGIITNVS